MALSATLAELETWIRQDADMQAPDDRVTSEECRNRINRSLAQLYDRLVLVDQEYFLKGVTTASNGSGKYDIQNDFATGVVRSVASVLTGGSGYTNGAAVTLSQGTNATATGVITASGGAITGVTLTGGGFGYVDAASTVASWQLVNATPLSMGPGIGASPVFVGNYAYFTVEDFATSNFYVLKVDMTSGAQTMSSTLSTNAVILLAYHVPSGQLVSLDSNSGSLLTIDPVTLAISVFPVAGAPFWRDNVPIVDPATGNIFAATSSDIYELDIVGTVISTTTPGFVIKSLLTSDSSGPSTVLYLWASPTDLYSVTTAPFGAPSLITSYPTDVVGAVYSPTSNRLFMAMSYPSVSSSQYYDFNTATTVSLDATLMAAGFVPGVCMPSYDATTNTVLYSTYLPLGASVGVVVEIDAATAAVTTSIATAAGQNATAARLGQKIITFGFPAGVGMPPSASTYLYEYSGGTGVNAPNYIVLNVSGGSNGQVIAYIESDFYKCKGVWFTNGDGSTPDNGDWSPLRRFSWEQQNALNQASIYGGMTALPLYRIVTEGTRDKVYISPDQLGGTFKLWYYPAPPRLLLPTDRFDGRAGWDEWIVKDVAIQLLMAEESVEQAATLKAVRDEIWQRIQLHAEDREAAQPQRIMDATLLSRRYGPRWAR